MDEKKDYIETVTILERREQRRLAYVNADGSISSFRTAGEQQESNREYLR